MNFGSIAQSRFYDATREDIVIRSFNGKTPRIAPSAFVSKGATVIGDVVIGAGSGVWPGAVIRADFASIEIGQDTMIEDNCVIHSGIPMTIGDNNIIGHGVVIHGKKIGSNNLIGNHATILDNSDIGDFCLIAAGCLVRTDMIVSDGSFVVGIPAEIKGRISSLQRQRLEGGSGSYRELVKQYKSEGF